MEAKINIDPHHHYLDREDQEDPNLLRLLEACGIILEWALDPAYYDLPLRETFDKCYQFGLYEMQGTISPSGVYSYPEDPDLFPYFSIERGDEVMHQYPHAIVAIVQKNGDSFITRMD